MYVEGDDFLSRDFRRGMWHQTTTAVALLTSAHEGRANVMACEWAMMVSHTPVCFVIAVGASHETHDLIEKSGEFGLSFCSDEQAPLSHISGSYSMRDVDKWSMADFHCYPAKKIAAPMIDGAVVNVECRVVATHRLGHTIFIGEAVWTRYDDEKSPLLYHDGKYWRMGEQVPKTLP